MRNQLTIIAAGLGLAVAGSGLFSGSASAMPASGVAAISEVNQVLDAGGLPVEHVQYYPYGFPCVFPFCGYGYGYGYYGPGYYGGGYYGRGYYGRGYGGRGYYGRGYGGRGHYGRGGVGGHGGGGRGGSRHR